MDPEVDEDKRPRALVVAPDARERARLAETLDAGGFEVCEGSDPARRSARLEAGVALVALDLSGAAEAALGLVREIRALEPTVPLLALVENPTDPLLQTLREAGATDFAPRGLPPALLRHHARTLHERADGSPRRRNERRSQDRLTGLATQPLLAELLRRLCQRAGRRRERFALLHIGLDDLQGLREELGRRCSDSALRELTRRFLRALAPSDWLSRVSDAVFMPALARLADDELAVVISELRDPRGPEQVANRLLEAIAEPLSIGNEQALVTASVGIAIGPDDGSDASMLLHRAAAAMHQARHDGGNRLHFHRGEPSRAAAAIPQLETRLQRAIERDQLELHYQPKADAGTRRVVGLEALLRWNDPELGLIPPDRFIPLIERSDLVVPLGLWCIRTACRQIVAWRRGGVSPGRVAVNVSPYQFGRPDFVESVLRLLDETEVRPEEVELEITEGSFIEREPMTATLRKLREHGISVAVDDFGTGYSSLQYLRDLPVDCLKIDRVFVRDCLADDKARSLTLAIIAVAWSLGLRVVAEGVETEEQWQLLRDHGCDEIQGFVFSRPLPAAACEVLIRDAADR